MRIGSYKDYAPTELDGPAIATGYPRESYDRILLREHNAPLLPHSISPHSQRLGKLKGLTRRLPSPSPAFR